MAKKSQHGFKKKLQKLPKMQAFLLSPYSTEKPGLPRVSDANEINTKNMKCTCPTQRPNARDPTQPIFHWMVLGFCVGRDTIVVLFLRRERRKFYFLRFFRYQHVGIPTQNSGVGGYCPTPTPDTRILRRSGI